MSKNLIANHDTLSSDKKSAFSATKWVLSAVACSVLLSMGTAHAGDVKAKSIMEAVTAGKVNGDMNMRYEMVSQDNALKDADGLTLRTRLTFTTADFNGFSSVVEFEDSRIVAGLDSFNDAVGNNTGYSVIADPETTELDQGFVQYKNNGFTAKAGRQVIALDNHRFVGHVGWRQDRQTFDAVTMQYVFNDAFKVDYGYLNQRNRIFAQDKDIDSKDHLFNASYKTDFGTLVGYGYLLQEDTNVDNSLDTFGMSFTGARDIDKIKLLYSAEYATQDADNAATSYSADYLGLEVGAAYMGITARVGYELLGSDNGAYGFATPLATLHKFNGWADQFLTTPGQGLADVYLSVGGNAYQGQWLVAFHDYEADKSSATVNDLGTEVNLQYTLPIEKHYSVGVKYAAYSAGDVGAGKVDTDKVWIWGSAFF